MINLSAILAASAFIGVFASLEGVESGLILRTHAFQEGSYIPTRYACKREGQNISPGFQWSGAPAETKGFAFICHDPDAPSGHFVHWVVYNIPAQAKSLLEGIGRREKLENGTSQGLNGFGNIGYDGPCPPPGKIHHYHYTLYALDKELLLEPGLREENLLMAIKSHIIAKKSYIGIFEKSH